MCFHTLFKQCGSPAFKTFLLSFSFSHSVTELQHVSAFLRKLMFSYVFNFHLEIRNTYAPFLGWISKLWVTDLKLSLFFCEDAFACKCACNDGANMSKKDHNRPPQGRANVKRGKEIDIYILKVFIKDKYFKGLFHNQYNDQHSC